LHPIDEDIEDKALASLNLFDAALHLPDESDSLEIKFESEKRWNKKEKL
jgi:hypothetical protein